MNSLNPEALHRVLTELREKHDADGGRESRQRERFEWAAPLRLEIEDVASGMGRRRELDVLACDLSRGGFSFVHPSYVHPGSLVCAQFTSLPDRPRISGIVRNCVHLHARLHRIGVEFTRSARDATATPDAERAVSQADEAGTATAPAELAPATADHSAGS